MIILKNILKFKFLDSNSYIKLGVRYLRYLSKL